jgi:hypothetical protein
LDGKIKAMRSLVGFSRLISELQQFQRRSRLAPFDEMTMKSMSFAPSIVVFEQVNVGDSWTAREKLGHPARAVDWND